QHGGDVNRDHELLFKAALVATRPSEHCIGAVYAFDTASSTEWAYPRSFVPDTWVDISETLETKIAAMACYESEVRPYPHPRSLDALRNRARAWGNQTCLEAAEVFLTVPRTSRPHHRTGRPTGISAGSAVAPHQDRRAAAALQRAARRHVDRGPAARRSRHRGAALHAAAARDPRRPARARESGQSVSLHAR